MTKAYYVYILASSRYGTLYIGVTSDLVKRVWQHREGLAEGFTKKYGIKQLVWFEAHEDVTAAYAPLFRPTPLLPFTLHLSPSH